ncbi:MAG: hypothetical protein A2341_03605 [Deltaproteobacteria bacterium RIFOXYB12_FULL_58_9]|nr:MAG: hypothetical protein A2341_03605 [Deltaproteobacteria bacterium RIFOXYB12_FULL_58_9]
MAKTTSSTIDEDSLLTSHEVGLLLQVDPSSVNKWVKAARLRAYRTPGGHLRIRAGDLLTFLRQHNMMVPKDLSKVGMRRLLVVDDSEFELRSIERLLKPYAHRVELLLVSRGIDALVQFGFFNPHAVLLDVIMPGLDGIEVCRRLKALEATRSVPVVITSAHLTVEMEHQALAAGAAQCVDKPIGIARLLAILQIDEQESSILTAQTIV